MIDAVAGAWAMACLSMGLFNLAATWWPTSFDPAWRSQALAIGWFLVAALMLQAAK